MVSGARVALGAWFCVWAGACTVGTAPAPAERADAGRDAPVLFDGGALVIQQSDGAPLPAVLASGTRVSLRVALAGTDAGLPDALWTAAGSCVLETGDARPWLNSEGDGPCTLTALAGGLLVTTTFTYVAVHAVAFTGDTVSPFAIGERRTLSAVAVGEEEAAADVPAIWTLPTPSPSSPGAFEVQQAGRDVTFRALAVGSLSFTVQVGAVRSGATLTALPAAIQISASSAHVRSGGDLVLDAVTVGPDGARCRVEQPGTMRLTGADGFRIQREPQLGRDGSVFFQLSGAVEDCPAIQIVTLEGTVASNALSVTVERIASVAIEGPAAPVVVGSTVSLRAVPADAAGQPFAGQLYVLWSDPANVLQIPATNALVVSAFVAGPGTSALVATVNGVSSPPFAVKAVPAP